jgi:hypothetical protein
LGVERHDALWRQGIRAFGRESAGDFPVIAARAGDPAAWSFEFDRWGVVEPWQAAGEDDLEEFFGSELSAEELAALTAYTGGWSGPMNAAVAGDEPPPVDPEAKAMVPHVLSALTKFSERAAASSYRPSSVTVRGVPIAAGFGDDPAGFFDSVFAVGARVDTGMVTSTSTSVRTALDFVDEGEPSYLMVIQSREGLPLHPIAMDPFESESIVAPGWALRCVHVDPHGIAGLPTVYLVDEEIAAAAQRKHDRTKELAHV